MPKLQLKLVDRQLVGDQVYLIIFHTQQSFAYKPGQFLSFKIAEGVVRSYSILELSKQSSFFNSSNISSHSDSSFISFIINTKQSGLGSSFMEQSAIGTEIEAIGPAGRFSMQDTPLNKVFVCTGTGLAPFVPMIKVLLSNKVPCKIDLYFGAKTSKDKFIDRFFSQEELSKISVYTSLSAEEPGIGEYKGFVNDAISSNIEEFKTQEFYLCGNPLMVESVRNMLEERGADKIYLEKYSL